MTQDPTFNLVPFAQDPENTPIIHIREIKGEEGEEVRAGKTVFRQVGRRRDGVGIVGEVRDFTGWEVEWRGLRFEVWQSMVRGDCCAMRRWMRLMLVTRFGSTLIP